MASMRAKRARRIRRVPLSSPGALMADRRRPAGGVLKRKFRFIGHTGPELDLSAPTQAINIKRRSWPQRFIRSYLGWRKCLGIIMSLRCAWIMSRAPVHADPAVPDPRSRPGRDWRDVSGGQLSEG